MTSAGSSQSPEASVPTDASGAQAPDDSEADEAATVDELVEQWEAEKPPAAGTASNVAAAVVVGLLGVLGLLGSLDLGVGAASAPGAGTWPALVSAAMVLLAVGLAITAPRNHDAEKFSGTSWLVVLGLATMVGFAMTVGTVGFEIPAALLAFVWLKVLGREGWRTSVVTSLLVTVAFYLIFVLALGTPIPHLF
ncbi:tripartite tricarboxylate transporter TctB family protein [Aeromicrobium sp. CF4.19]|uniref:tripartite tricarboxylate transporter TctB family protein n=1 Tax=Aeromicrobium sp. CF4.19 TaxID=3373082 RepID=UPI003EE813E8